MFDHCTMLILYFYCSQHLGLCFASYANSVFGVFGDPPSNCSLSVSSHKARLNIENKIIPANEELMLNSYGANYDYSDWQIFFIYIIFVHITIKYVILRN